jgi:hypothetical protein
MRGAALVSYGTWPLASLNPQSTAFALRQPEGKEQENDQIYATTPRGQSLPRIYDRYSWLRRHI